VGFHKKRTGERELVDGKVAGIAVHIGARVAAAAQPSEVLVSSTVKDLVAGSGLAFQDRGPHGLKGVPTNGVYSQSSTLRCRTSTKSRHVRPPPASWSAAGDSSLTCPGVQKCPLSGFPAVWGI
jgi:hypothetical protein